MCVDQLRCYGYRQNMCFTITLASIQAGWLIILELLTYSIINTYTAKEQEQGQTWNEKRQQEMY